ncbi:hypothetical protein [Actinokineospora enzanensis]|uniref:hypothetical protein n=1 Tax=Actinokineospora enzanensis TaxID=155975 RepID=UPI00036E76E3|nr:hypothetical protein [Actinokineospora enzanensis]
MHDEQDPVVTDLGADTDAKPRRQAVLAGAGVAVAVAAIAAGAVFLPGLGNAAGSANQDSGNQDSGIQAAAPRHGRSTAASTTGTSTGPTSTSTGSPSSTGSSSSTASSGGPGEETQDGKTQTAGPHAQLGEHLLNQLLSSVPAGLTSPADLMPKDGQLTGPLRYHQASKDLPGANWRYLAQIPVGKDGHWGRLLAEVHHNGTDMTGCELARSLWGLGGECTTIAVDGKQVGVVTKPGNDDRLDQWAAYRYPDGTVVFIAQAKEYAYSGHPAIAQEPFTAEQLARQAVDPKFRLR